MPMSRSVITNTGVCSRSARSSAAAHARSTRSGPAAAAARAWCRRARRRRCQQVGLLRARGHAGGRAAALHVDDGDRDLGEVGQADELGHQRHAGARGGGEGARAVPAGAHHHADGGDLVLGLHDGVAASRRWRGRAVLGAVLLEGLGHRRRRRDRVPGAHRGAAVHAAQRRGAVAVDEDAVAHLVGARTRRPSGGCRCSLAKSRPRCSAARWLPAAFPCPCTARRTASR
jgi:hypothetical protein